MSDAPTCPACGTSTWPIVWGYAGVELTELRDETVVGGCVVDVDDDGRVARFQCPACATRVDEHGAALVQRERTEPIGNPFSRSTTEPQSVPLTTPDDPFLGLAVGEPTAVIPVIADAAYGDDEDAIDWDGDLGDDTGTPTAPHPDAQPGDAQPGESEPVDAQRDAQPGDGQSGDGESGEHRDHSAAFHDAEDEGWPPRSEQR